MTHIAIADDWSHEERRAYERYSVNFYLRVIDVDSDTLLGNVVDISLNGMRLVSETLLPVDKTHRVRMEIALGEDDTEHVDFVATSIWSREDLTPGLYESGWKNTLSPAASRSLQRLIDRISSM
jgi:c-di-GMP-binding flagellar brake protein YcgR